MGAKDIHDCLDGDRNGAALEKDGQNKLRVSLKNHCRHARQNLGRRRTMKSQEREEEEKKKKRTSPIKASLLVRKSDSPMSKSPAEQTDVAKSCEM